MWPTPVHSEARQGYQNRNNGKKGSQKSLTTVVVEEEMKLWPTPVASDTGIRKKNYAQGGEPLSKAAWMWPTPSAQQQQGGVQGLVGGSGHREKMKKAGHHEMLTGSLNPTWVEKLMGWPENWTDIENPRTKPMEGWDGDKWESGIPRVVEGTKHRVARLKAIGNGQVPQVAAMAWEILMNIHSPE